MDLADYLRLRFLNLHKKEFIQSTKVKERVLEMNVQRKNHRQEVVFGKRKIPETMSPFSTPGVKREKAMKEPEPQNVQISKRLEMLALWKAEKEKSKKLQKTKKPLFKVTHVPISIGLPDLECVNKTIKGKAFVSKFAPPDHKFKPPENIKPIDFKYVGAHPSNTGNRDAPNTNKVVTRSQTRNIEPSVVVVKGKLRNTSKTNESLNNNVKKSKKVPASKTGRTATPKVELQLMPSSRNQISRKQLRNPEEQNKNLKKGNPGTNETDGEIHDSDNSKQVTKSSVLKAEKPVVQLVGMGKAQASIIHRRDTSRSQKTPKKENKTPGRQKKELEKSELEKNVDAELLDSDDSKSDFVEMTKSPASKVGKPVDQSLETGETLVPVIHRRSTLKRQKTPRIEHSTPERQKNDIEKNEFLENDDDTQWLESGNSKTDFMKTKKSSASKVKKPVVQSIETGEAEVPVINRRNTLRSQKTPRKEQRTPEKKVAEKNEFEENEKDIQLLNKTMSPDFPASEVQKLSTPPAPVYISPFVTISRGKNSARKEYAARKSQNSTPTGSITVEHASPRAGAAYFSWILDTQIVRLEEICDKWVKYKETESPPEEACSMIDVALGQTNLLITKKFAQFRGLIDKCKDADATSQVKCEDLHGFWDMVYIQVKNLDTRFENLENLKANRWLEVLPERPKLRPTKKTTTFKNSKPSAALKAAILAARWKNGEALKGTPVKRRSSYRVGDRKSADSPGLMMMKVAQYAKDMETPGKSILKNEGSKSVRSQLARSVLFVDEVDIENDLNKSNVPGGSKTPSRRSLRLHKTKLL